MKIYRCPKCNNYSTYSYCSECDTKIPANCVSDVSEDIYEEIKRKSVPVANSGKSDNMDFFRMRKEYNSHVSHYDEIERLERINPDMAYAMSKSMLTKGEQKMYKKRYAAMNKLRVAWIVILLSIGLIGMVSQMGGVSISAIIYLFIAAVIVVSAVIAIRNFMA